MAEHEAVVRPGIYEHWKGGLYEVLYTASFETTVVVINAESRLPLVIYMAKDGTGRHFARTLPDFTSTVEGKPRFKLIADTTTIATPPVGTGEPWQEMAKLHGAYYFKDGSWVIWRESYWAAYGTGRVVVKDADGWLIKFSSCGDAGEALAKLGQGPAAG